MCHVGEFIVLLSGSCPSDSRLQYDHVFSPIGSGMQHGSSLEMGAAVNMTRTALLLHVTKRLAQTYERQRMVKQLLQKKLKKWTRAQTDMLNKTQRNWRMRVEAMRKLLPVYRIPLSSSVFGD